MKTIKIVREVQINENVILERGGEISDLMKK